MRPLGRTLLLWRNERKLTQAKLAALTGISRPNLSAIEQGSRDVTVRTLRRLAQALGVRPGQLVDGEGPEPTYTIDTSDRQAMDRVARLAAGERLSASAQEKKTALALSSLMKSKTGWKGLKRIRRGTARSESEMLRRLKSELGPETLAHLIRRVDKVLGGAP
ncbi:MAG: hypothetical protein MOGMAGMI_02156 [Candidatus Omnitrophica bacterium]|nr:hypothetical protein [Candidatus Omnitrophota bacterium]